MAKYKPYRYPLYLCFRGLAYLVCLLPWSWAVWLGRRVGALSFYLVGRQREKTLENLRTAFDGKKSEAGVRAIAKKVFEHQGQTAAEVLQFPKMTFERMSRLVDPQDGFQVYENLLREGRGLISITAHVGNWELLAGVFCLKGFKGAVVGRRIYYEPYNRWIVGLRRCLSVETLYRDDSAIKILRLLKNNQIVGLLPDQDLPSLSGIFVDFFGRPAYTSVAPARLALASGAPILPNFLIRGADGRYKLLIKEPIRPAVNQNRDEAIRECTQAWMRVFEGVIREYPEQWAWMHNRWKTQPETPGFGQKEIRVSSC